MGLFSFLKKDKNKVKEQEQEIVETLDKDVESDSKDSPALKDESHQEPVNSSKIDDEKINTDKDDEISIKTNTSLDENDVALDTHSPKIENNKQDTVVQDEEDQKDKDLKEESYTNDNKDTDSLCNAQDDILVKETKEQVKESFFARLKRTRESLAFGISSLIKGRKIDDDLYEELETALLSADLGVDTTFKIIEKLKKESKLKELRDAELLKKNLYKILCDILEPCAIPLDIESQGKPYVILMVGVNGAGKTTTIGKLAQKYKAMGKKVMLAAGDTFRAAAVEQLKEWGSRVDVPVIAQMTGSDSASVLYDALSAAKARDIDVLICDTAGRLQNKDNLMEELKKIVRVMQKIDPSGPQEVMLVLDAATGQNAVSQAKIFSDAVAVTGITLTKLDGTAKGGVIFALADNYKIPIRYVGIGEKAKDLREFEVEPFVEALIKH